MVEVVDIGAAGVMVGYGAALVSVAATGQKVV